jgi:hypothetical protein
VCSGSFTDVRFQAVGWHPSVKKSSTFELVRGAEMALKLNLKSEVLAQRLTAQRKRPQPQSRFFGVGGQRTRPEQPPTSCCNAGQARGMAYQDRRPHPPQEQGVCPPACVRPVKCGWEDENISRQIDFSACRWSMRAGFTPTVISVAHRHPTRPCRVVRLTRAKRTVKLAGAFARGGFGVRISSTSFHRAKFGENNLLFFRVSKWGRCKTAHCSCANPHTLLMLVGCGGRLRRERSSQRSTRL